MSEALSVFAVHVGRVWAPDRDIGSIHLAQSHLTNMVLYRFGYSAKSGRENHLKK